MAKISLHNRTRHLKCDEEKPTCRRCRSDRVKCDGYSHSKTTKDQRCTNTNEQSLSIITVDHYVSDIPLERYYFYHFCRWTCKQLSNSPDTLNFWVQYVLPLSHNSDPVRHAITAVGAAHRFFTAGSDTRSLQHMEILTKQYNKAISKIIPCLSDSSIHSIHITLVCCLLFIAFESILGRHAESVHHLRAGNHLLALPILAETESNNTITGKIKEMLSAISVEASAFTDDAILPDVPQSWVVDRAETTNEGSSGPFQDLQQAASELCKLEAQFTALAKAHCCECSSDDSCSTLQSEDEMDDPDDCYKDPFFEDLRRRFKIWLVRFEITKRALELQQSPHTATEQFLYLTLAQKFWSMNLYFVTEPVFDSTAEFLDAAENLAKTIANPDYFTFSLDGSLISGLSFIVRACEDAGDRKRALTLLRSLNRREGLWDSREIVEMHERTLSFDNFQLWYDKEYSGSVPSYLAKVAKELERIK